LSSESPAAVPAAAYTFRQLQPPPGGQVGDVLGAAYAEADEIRRQARIAGEQEGRLEAHAAVRAELEPTIAALTDAAVSRLESDAALLALRLAEQIVAGAIAVEPARIVDVAEMALRRISDRREVTLTVNPADLELLKDAIAGVQSELGGIEHISVQADRRVSRGGVVARTEAGEIDATIITQLARAREIVINELAPPPADPEPDPR
jgi:flagellar biosynthesis/type III secretory pathway protein FliH